MEDINREKDIQTDIHSLDAFNIEMTFSVNVSLLYMN